jgi:hypothetical protein
MANFEIQPFHELEGTEESHMRKLRVVGPWTEIQTSPPSVTKQAC